MIWAKTDAGRAEMQTGALVKERARRNLLLLIDGNRSEEVLLSHLAGIGAEDFQALRKLDLIAPTAGAVTVGDPTRVIAAEAARAAAPPMLEPSEQPQSGVQDMMQFSAALTRVIASHLGLRGFTLTLAVEKASDAEDLETIAQRALEQIRERKGEDVAAEARRALYGA